MTQDNSTSNGARLGDIEISAWLDGMMDKDGALAMTELAASDETMAARAERLRHIDDLVRSAVPAEEAIPPELLERLGLSGVATADKVVNLAAARKERGRRAEARAARTAPVGRNGLWRIAAQVALVAGLGASLALWNASSNTRQGDASYRTLSDAAQPAALRANAMVVFAPGVDAAGARAIAAGAGARLIGEPNAAGAWKLALAPARRDAVLAALRADDRVTLAEAMDGQVP